MLDISEPKKGQMEEAKKGSLWELGSYRRWDVWIPLPPPPPPTRSIFEMRMSRRIVLTITTIYKTHTSLNVGKDNFVVACLCLRQNVDPEVSRPNRAIAAQKCNKKCDARAFILCFSLLFFHVIVTLAKVVALCFTKFHSGRNREEKCDVTLPW